MATLHEQRRDIQLVVFQLAHQLLAVDIGAVKEIVTGQPITFVPQAPAFIEGIINLRGRLIPIIDLRKWFGVQGTNADAQVRIVVLEQDAQIMGLVVDGVSEVLRISTDRIEPAGAIMSGLQTDVIQGIVKTDTKLIILLDAAELMQADGIAGITAIGAMAETAVQEG